MKWIVKLLGVLVLLALPVTAQDHAPLPEGLVEFENAKIDFAALRPGVDWAKYKTIMLYELAVTPAARDATPEHSSTRRYAGESWVLRDKDIKLMQEEFAKVMEKELPKGGFSFVTEPQADTLIIVPTIIDIYLTAPIEDTRRTNMSRGATYTEGAGALTIAVILADGETLEVVAEGVDQRYPSSSNMWKENTRVFNIGDMRSIFRAWGKMMRKRLPDFASGKIETP